MDFIESKKVNVVVYKLKGAAAVRWDNLQYQIDRVPGASLPNLPTRVWDPTRASWRITPDGPNPWKYEPMCCAWSNNSKERWKLENMYR